MAPSCGINRKHVIYRYNRYLYGISLIKCQSLTGFAKLLVTTNFKFEKTSRRPKILICMYITNAVGMLHRSVFVKTLPLRGRVSM
jgi:hypothetical protein